ncbi:MAG: Hsp20/alpha crystallin family protein [Firmicutes bacterium]|nr:Hsp20/alpha crystallin family protein [Bacillota bacterium]
MLSLVPFESTGNNIFNYLDNMERNFFGNFYSGQTHFRTDIEDAGDRYVLTAELPGYEKEDISVDVSEDMLTIKAEKHVERSEEDENRYVRKERRYGSLCRSFNVSGIDTEDICAEYKNGILTLEMPKTVPESPDVRKIEIQ